MKEFLAKKKNALLIALIFVIVAGVYNLILFLSAKDDALTSGFWTAYAFMWAAFLGVIGSFLFVAAALLVIIPAQETPDLVGVVSGQCIVGFPAEAVSAEIFAHNVPLSGDTNSYITKTVFIIAHKASLVQQIDAISPHPEELHARRHTSCANGPLFPAWRQALRTGGFRPNCGRGPPA